MQLHNIRPHRYRATTQLHNEPSRRESPVSTTDRIEKRVTVHAPQTRVWQAIADAQAFGQWFGITLDGAFVEGESIHGRFDGELQAELILEFQQKLGLEPSPVRMPEPDAVFCTVVRIDAPRYFAFRWIPYGVDASIDPVHEPTTLVEFTLRPVADGTELTIVESGFDQVPAARRLRAFRMNDAGWTAQADNIARHLAHDATSH